MINLIPKAMPKDKRLLVGILLGVFVVGGVFGFVYETLFYLINNGVWTRRGTTFGPFIQLYGYGGLILVATCWRLRKKPWAVFLVSGAVCGLLELVVGWAFYTFGNGFRSWDYNTEIWNWGNIGGFVCLRSVLFFALSGVILMYVVLPLLLWLTRKMTPKAFLILMGTLAGIALLDCLYNDILVNIFPALPRALFVYRDSGWYGIVAGVDQL